MKVSILMTTYNQEGFVAQAIDSILMQDTSFSYEIVICEDASSDGTRGIVSGFQKRHPDKIRLLLRDEVEAERDRVAGIGGKGGFVNGLMACKGEYVALLDGDDYWTDPKKLQKQIDFLQAHDECVICFHNATILSEAGKEAALFCPPDQKETSTLEDLLAGNFMFSGSVVFRRGLFDELPEWFKTTRTGDWALHAINAKYGKIGYLNEVMATYRVHSGGFWSLEKSADQLISGIELLDRLNAHFGFKYDREIKASQGKYYEELSDIRQQEGDLNGAKSFLAKRLKVDFSNSRIPNKYFLLKFFRLQVRAICGWFGLSPNSTYLRR